MKSRFNSFKKMYLKYYFIGIGLSLVFTSSAQVPNAAWINSVGGSSYDFAEKVVIDLNGHVYNFGQFRDTVDFDPSNGQFNMITDGSYNVFIQKLDENGQFIWARQFANCLPGDITTDLNGNVLFSGSFQQTFDADPSNANFNLLAEGLNDAFIIKLDAQGNFVWAKCTGGSGSDQGKALTTDNDGNIYNCGTFQFAVDANPGPSMNMITSNGESDIFIQKLDSNGNFVWFKKTGGINSDAIESIAFHPSGFLFVTGYFWGSIDVDPSAGNTTFTSLSNGYDFFIQKLTLDGNFVLGKQFGGFGSDIANQLSLDTENNLLLTGSFESTIDMNPGVGSFILTAAGWNDVFVLKLDDQANFLWAAQIASADIESGYSIVSDQTNNVYVLGSFRGITDLDPYAGTLNLQSNGYDDLFILKLDSNGGFVWASSVGGTGNETSGTITSDTAGNIIFSGSYLESVDLNPGSLNSTYSSNGTWDVFVVKLSEQASLNETITAESWKVFPNPTLGKCTLFADKYLTNVNVSLETIEGRQIFTENYSSTNQIELDLTDRTGVYFVTLRTNETADPIKLKIWKY